MSLLKRLFRHELIRINEEDMIREKNLLISKISLHNQVDANELWETSYYNYRMKAMERNEYNFRISAFYYANEELRRYMDKLNKESFK